MATATIPVLIFTDPATDDLVPGLPIPSENLFQRIIRNPRPDTPHARERECTEMLASVLLNAPLLRDHLFFWMAGLNGLEPSKFDIGALQFEIETERFIGAKRVDLRISGHSNSDVNGPITLLWIVEVKVGSPFHKSSVQNPDNKGEPLDDDVEEMDGEFRSQLEDYDDWLATRPAKHRGGFVLALGDLSTELPPLKLKCGWKCLSWTRLGLRVKTFLEQKNLPPQEVVLAKHLLGFIRANLWRNSEMPEMKLEFNHIAFIRAFSEIGKECEELANAMMETVRPVVEKSGVGYGKVTPLRHLYKWRACSSLWRLLVPGWKDGDVDPQVDISIGYLEGVGDYMGVWVLMSPKHPRWDNVWKVANHSLKKLVGRNPKWEAGTGEADDWSIWVVTVPLTDLLAAEDQQRALADFVRAALHDLKVTGAIDALKSAVGRPTKGTRKK